MNNNRWMILLIWNAVLTIATGILLYSGIVNSQQTHENDLFLNNEIRVLDIRIQELYTRTEGLDEVDIQAMIDDISDMKKDIKSLQSNIVNLNKWIEVLVTRQP